MAVAEQESVEPLTRELVQLYSGGDPHAFGEALKAAREALGLSAERLARELGVTPQAVYRWQRGSALPRRSNIDAVLALLESPLSLIGERGEAEFVGVRALEWERVQRLTESAAAVWSFYTESFVEVGSPEAREHLMETLRASRRVQYYYVYPRSEKGARAFGSFAEQMVPEAEEAGLIARIIGLEVSPAHFLRLAPVLAAGTRTVLVEFAREAQKEQGRTWRAFTEMPVVTRDGDIESGRRLWLEWPEERVEWAALGFLADLREAMRDEPDKVQTVTVASALRQAGEAVA